MTGAEAAMAGGEVLLEARNLCRDVAAGERLVVWIDRVLAGASPRTLKRLFQSETGLSFGQWRRQVRLIAALEMLAMAFSTSSASESSSPRARKSSHDSAKSSSGASSGSMTTTRRSCARL